MNMPMNYTPDVVVMSDDMKKVAAQITADMERLQGIAKDLEGTQSGAAVRMFAEAGRLWNSSGLAQAGMYTNVARVANQSYNDVTAYDNRVAGEFTV